MLYSILRTLANIIFTLVFNVKVLGKENIPTEKGYILVANHRTMADPVFCVMRTKTPFRFMAKEELFSNKLLGALFRGVGAFPIARGSGDMSTIDHAIQVIKDGNALLVFPEGTRSKNGIPGRPRLGAALIAGQTGADVLPVSIDYGKRLGFRKKIIVRYHPILMAEELAIQVEEPRSMRAASKRMMDAITAGLTQIPKALEERVDEE